MTDMNALFATVRKEVKLRRALVETTRTKLGMDPPTAAQWKASAIAALQPDSIDGRAAVDAIVALIMASEAEA